MPKRDRRGRFVKARTPKRDRRGRTIKGRKRPNPTPREWSLLGPSSYYPCHPWERKKVGKRVPGRGGGTITACATPAKTRKGTAAARRRRPEGQYWIGQAAAGHAMPKSRVRRRIKAARYRGGLRADDPLTVHAQVREFERSGFPAPWGQPFPHRPGSSRLDAQHPAWKGYTAAVKRAIREGERTGRDPLDVLRGHPRFKEWTAINREAARNYEARARRVSAHSQQRERAQYRQAAIEAGIDVTSAEFRDEYERMR